MLYKVTRVFPSIPISGMGQSSMREVSVIMVEKLVIWGEETDLVSVMILMNLILIRDFSVLLARGMWIEDERNG